MSKNITRLLSLVLLCLVCGSAGAQQANRPPNLSLGDAVVTGFSGILPADPAQQRARTTSAIDLTFINPDGPSARVIDLSRPGYVWDGRLLTAPKKFDALAKDVGQVFGVALDDQPQPNIYVAATSVFGLHIVARGRDGLPERRKKGGPGAGWMKGQFGLDLQGGPGGIYRIDGSTGVVTLLANVTLDGVPNPGPGLGNLAYDSAHKQLFVSDLYTGMIHRIDLEGRDLGAYDHGVSGRGAAGTPPLAFDPRLRPNIASDRFDSENPATWGFAPAGRQVWGLAVNEGRLYYSVSAGPQIWSVGIQQDGSFAADPRWELDVPAQPGPMPVSDIAFSPQGAMILAQRAPIGGSYDYSAFTRPGEPQVLRFSLKAPNEPPSPGRWTPMPGEYAVGLAGNYRNTNGGVTLGYGYSPDGTLDTTSACAAAVWTTGQNLRNNPALRSQLEPGGPLLVEGLQGSPADMLRPANAAPAASYFIDYDDKFDDARASGHMGSVRILARPCAAPLAYVSGPTSPASPAAGGGGVRPPPPPPPPPNVCVAPGLPPGLPTSLSLPPCTQPGQAVSLDLSTVTYPAGLDPNWAVTPGGPQGHSTSNLPAWNVLPNNWIQPRPFLAVQWNNPVQTYTYTRSFNLICAPESYRSLKLSGNFGCDNTGTAALNGNPLPPGSGPSCYHNPPVPAGGIPFSHAGPTFFVQGLNSLTMTVKNTPPGGPTGLSVVAKLEAECGTDCLCKIIDLTIGKENTPQGGSGTSFNLWVTNVGVPITFPVGGLTVTDVIPTGMTVTSVTAPNWTCTPATVIGLGTLTCTYNLAGSLATGAQLPGSIVVNYTTTGPGPFTNCATISAGAVVGVDTNSANNTACVTVTPSPGSLSVTKVVAPDPRGIGNALTFPMTVSCTNPTASYSLNVLGNTSTLPINVPVGSLCSVTETLPSLPSGCTWLAPVYTPASVTIATGLNHLKVTNAYRCREQSGSLIVKKEVIYVGPITLPSQIYPVTVNCGGTITTLNLLDGVPQTVSNITLNTSCTVVEGPVPTPPNVCPPNTTPVWTTAYIPPSPLTITGPGITELVRNTLVCRPIPIQVSTCPPPMVPGPIAGQCICPLNTVRKGKKCVRQQIACPEGTVKKGRECVRPTVCTPPARLNRRGVCECPTNMEAKRKGCVARERREQPSVPDGIRNIPGGFGPGGGGRREPSGGGRGSERPAGGGGGSPGTSPGRH